VATSSEPYWRSRALDMQSTLALYRGRLDDALKLLTEAENLFSEPNLTQANLLLGHSSIELLLGHGEKALELAERAYRSARGYPVETDILSNAALAQALLGRTDEVSGTFEDLRTRYQLLPSRIVTRSDNFLLGSIALLAKHYDEAVARFEEAWSTYPEGVDTSEETHCYVTALAYWESGRHDEAAQWFSKIQDHPNERLSNPIGYVRSLYYLGRYYTEKGDRTKGRAYLNRFVEHWGDGSLDPQFVAKARSLLGT
jgi:tetratricopeptide (TPR) repeat protein